MVATLEQVFREEWGRVLRRLGRTDEARDAYRRARQLTEGDAERRFLERRFLERRLAELEGTTGQG